ncbi:class I SAM-dependent methyltransferase [Thiocapsa roseopersicina]|uniref:Putative zinc binding domain-containing protein n=1 Tax=Thiocapsa roseopersicina TaxID=1058 RepID=A0A1H2Y6K1_THIRO|nr:class I SAM-dependent methyltransferase [Thiocapsa roseopersicina]SDX00264.1 Putative zinc binding domain-containing protein [Thiocapsa roseopersicina]
MNERAQAEAALTECPVCGSSALTGCLRIEAMPTYCNVLWSSAGEAREASRGDIDLAFCRDCGHVFNRVFDPGLMDYSEGYENSLHFSPKFNAYATALANRLVERYDIRGKDVIELGCGKGDFLAMICAAGDNRGTGFDKSFESGREGAAAHPGLTFVQDYYSKAYADRPADLVVCRHVLEHIQYPKAFLDALRETLDTRPDTLVYFEVPNALFTLRDLGIWDLIYEHCSYFTPGSLGRVFADSGFRVVEQNDAFEGQFLSIEALPARSGESGLLPEPEELAAVTLDVDAFAESYRAKVVEWQSRLRLAKDAGKKTVVWGAGSKGVTFLNIVRESAAIDYIVDLNPHKHGKYVPGTGQQVVSADFLVSYRPDQIIVMNEVYLDEIKNLLSESGVESDVRAV